MISLKDLILCGIPRMVFNFISVSRVHAGKNKKNQFGNLLIGCWDTAVVKKIVFFADSVHCMYSHLTCSLRTSGGRRCAGTTDKTKIFILDQNLCGFMLFMHRHLLTLLLDHFRCAWKGFSYLRVYCDFMLFFILVHVQYKFCSVLLCCQPTALNNPIV